MKPKDYKCSGAIRSPTVACSDFAPSARSRKGQLPTLEEQRSLQDQCTKAAFSNNFDKYKELGCKRLAHVQVPFGREAARSAAISGKPVTLEPKTGRDDVTAERRHYDPSYNYTRRTQNEGSYSPPGKNINAEKIKEYFSSLIKPGAGQLVLTRPPTQKMLAALTEVKTVANKDRFDKLIRLLQKKKKLVFLTGDRKLRVVGKPALPELVLDSSFQMYLLGLLNKKFIGTMREPDLGKSLLTFSEKSSDSVVFQIPAPNKLTVDGKNYAFLVLAGVRVGNKTKSLRGSFSKVIERYRSQSFERRQEDDALAQAFALIPYRAIRKAFGELAEDGAKEESEDGAKEEYFVVFTTPDGARPVEVKLSSAKMQHFNSSRKEAEGPSVDYHELRGLTTSELYAYLAGTLGGQPHRRRRGRNLPALTLARENSVAPPVLLDLDRFSHLAPGQMEEIGGGYCVYRLDRKGQKPEAWKSQLRVVPCSQAETWKDLSKDMKTFGKRRPASSRPTASSSDSAPKENSMTSRSRHNPDAALDALIAEFGPEARGHDSSLSPVFDEVYSASGGYGPYGLSDAPYGGRAMLPVNRRNPKKKGPSKAKEGTWQFDFARLAERARQIRDGMKDEQGRSCSLKEAFALARAELGGDAFYTPKRRSTTPPPSVAAANPRGSSEWNKKFGDIVRKAAEVQRKRGCTLEEAFDRAFTELQVERRHPRGHWAKKNEGAVSLDDDMIRLSRGELTELANRGYTAAAHELARRNAGRKFR